MDGKLENIKIKKLLDGFAASPGNLLLAEIVAENLLEIGAIDEYELFILSPAVTAHYANSPLLCMARAKLDFAKGSHVEVVERLECFLAIENIEPHLEKSAMLLVVESCLENHDEELARKWLKFLGEKHPDDYINLEERLKRLSLKGTTNEKDLISVKQVTEEATVKGFDPLDHRLLTLTFDEVGGMADLKKIAQMKIINPFKNPALFKKYGKKGGGGILLYGPPGCGKTYFSRAIAGECSASFFNVGIHEILDMYLGNSEQNMHNLFEAARKQTPAIIFIDEIDALGKKRELSRYSSMTGVINVFLNEMDGLEGNNENILIIGATNSPWDVDTAFKRPGRFDTLFFVPPPDYQGRKDILQGMVENRPVSDLDYDLLARDTVQFSGADLSAFVDRSVERVIDEVMRTGVERDIAMTDFTVTLKDMKSSIFEWLATAESYVEYANQEGQYDDIKKLLEKNSPKKQRRRLGFI